MTDLLAIMCDADRYTRDNVLTFNLRLMTLVRVQPDGRTVTVWE